MAHISAPIRLKIKNLHQSWSVNGGQLSSKRVDTANKFVFIDPWEIRKEFLGMRTLEDLLRFLNRVGQFTRSVDSLVVEHYWAWQKVIRKMLLVGGRDSLERALWESGQSIPKVLRGRGTTIFATVEFGSSKDGRLIELTVIGTLEGMITSVRIDHARSAKFMACARPDCAMVFPKRAGKIYCQQYCGHIESLRRTRARQRKSKKR